MKIIGKSAAIVTKGISDAPKHTKSLASSFTAKVKSGSSAFADKVKEGWQEGMGESDVDDDVVVFDLTDDVIEAQA